ncbi:MAG: hypothetical protein AB7S77_19255 [Desulfatirhabdiaceae bacterium]
MENSISITRGKDILANHTTDSPMSHYGQKVWSVVDSEPLPGHALWKQGDNCVDIEIVAVVGGWLVVKQPDGFLAGIIWSDGSYHADLIINADGHPVKKMVKGCHVRDTLPIGELGSILI